MARKKTGKIPARNTFYIITNGRQTEFNYFTLLKVKISTYDVKVEFQNADPLGLVEYAKKYISSSNQVWCVFDIDSTYEEKRLIPAITEAKQSGIKYAFSNVAFEVWLISHFQKIECEKKVDELKKILTECLKEQKSRTRYDKTDIEQLKKYFVPKYRQAINNSKNIFQKKTREHTKTFGENVSPQIWTWCSCTNVFKLVEARKLQKE